MEMSSNSTDTELIVKLQHNCNEWYNRHRQMGQKVKDLCELYSKTTFLTASKVNSSIGDNVLKSSNLSYTLIEEIDDVCDKIHVLEKDLLTNLATVKTTRECMNKVMDVRDSSTTICNLELRFIDDIIRQLCQQSLLITTIVSSVTKPMTNDDASGSANEDSYNMIGNGSMGAIFDHDCTVSLIACFQYSPYLKINQLQMLLDYKV